MLNDVSLYEDSVIKNYSSQSLKLSRLGRSRLLLSRENQRSVEGVGSNSTAGGHSDNRHIKSSRIEVESEAQALFFIQFWA